MKTRVSWQEPTLRLLGTHEPVQLARVPKRPGEEGTAEAPSPPAPPSANNAL